MYCILLHSYGMSCIYHCTESHSFSYTESHFKGELHHFWMWISNQCWQWGGFWVCPAHKALAVPTFTRKHHAQVRKVANAQTTVAQLTLFFHKLENSHILTHHASWKKKEIRWRFTWNNVNLSLIGYKKRLAGANCYTSSFNLCTQIKSCKITA